MTAVQLRSLRGAGVAGAADESVLEVSVVFVLLFVVVDVSVGAVLLSVAFGSAGVMAGVAGAAGMALVSAGVDCGVVAVVEVESLDWATATPMPASRAAAAATADNFF